MHLKNLQLIFLIAVLEEAKNLIIIHGKTKGLRALSDRFFRFLKHYLLISTKNSSAVNN